MAFSELFYNVITVLKIVEDKCKKKIKGNFSHVKVAIGDAKWWVCHSSIMLTAWQ